MSDIEDAKNPVEQNIAEQSLDEKSNLELQPQINEVETEIKQQQVESQIDLIHYSEQICNKLCVLYNLQVINL